MIKLNGCTFKLRMATYWKNIITKNFCKIKSYGDEAIDFHDKQIPKMDSNYTCLVVINLDSALKKIWKLLSASVFKRMQIHWKRKKVARYILGNLRNSSDSDESDEKQFFL